VAPDWNMVSLPVRPLDRRVSKVFPGALSRAYTYSGGYVLKDTLALGSGYWIRFASAETLTVTGDSLRTDSVAVTARWNMVGAISMPLAAAEVSSDPPGLIAGGFYQYSSGAYSLADTLRPGKAYWVRMNASGRLIFSPPGSVPPSSRIRIVPDGESPPEPPAEFFATGSLPQDYTLSQNFPNPFNPSTAITYQVPVESYVTVKVFNLLGQEIAVLAEGMKRPGVYTIEWRGIRAPSGVYYYTMNARDLTRGSPGSFTQTRKMVIVR